jgi:hypothetical protein
VRRAGHGAAASINIHFTFLDQVQSGHRTKPAALPQLTRSGSQQPYSIS